MIDTYRRAMKDSYDTFNVNSYQNQMRKALRASRGFPCFELRLEAGEEEAMFLASYAHLTADEDKTDETKLSEAAQSLLKTCMAIREDFKATFADGDLNDEARLNQFYAKAVLKILAPSKLRSERVT